MEKTLFIAHRGGGKGVFENKLETIKKSLEDPSIDGVEVDIRLTKDKVLVVHHDRGVYMSGKRVWIDSLNYEHIRHLGVPTLYEVAKLAEKHKKTLNIDIKDERCAPSLALYLKENRFLGALYVDCFHLDTLLDLEADYPEGIYSLTHNPKDTFDFSRRFVVRIFLLLTAIFFSRVIIYLLKKKFRKVSVDGITIHYQFANKNFIKDLKTFGFKVFVYGVTTKSQLTQFVQWQVDGIKTEHTEIFK